MVLARIKAGQAIERLETTRVRKDGSVFPASVTMAPVRNPLGNVLSRKLTASEFTRELPGAPFDPAHVRPHNMWGCSNAQIFSEVSPEMHWEFAVRHDLRWLTRWGLTYYGCCEPLDRKIDILRQIPNLRKISVSPWCNTPRVIAKIGAGEFPAQPDYRR